MQWPAGVASPPVGNRDEPPVSPHPHNRSSHAKRLRPPRIRTGVVTHSPPIDRRIAENPARTVARRRSLRSASAAPKPRAQSCPSKTGRPRAHPSATGRPLVTNRGQSQFASPWLQPVPSTHSSRDPQSRDEKQTSTSLDTSKRIV
jgi:hypothetical protein